MAAPWDDIKAAFAAGNYDSANYLLSLWNITESQARQAFGNSGVDFAKTKGITFTYGGTPIERLSGSNVPGVANGTQLQPQSPFVFGAAIKPAALAPVPTGPLHTLVQQLPTGVRNNLPMLALAGAGLLFLMRKHIKL